MIECNAIFMTGLVRVSAIGGSASDANRQVPRWTAKRNNERRIDYGIDIRQRRRRARSSGSCHARESGHPKSSTEPLDSRVRGNDDDRMRRHRHDPAPARFRNRRLSVGREPSKRSLDRELKQ
jgi:hypothetical protein